MRSSRRAAGSRRPSCWSRRALTHGSPMPRWADPQPQHAARARRRRVPELDAGAHRLLQRVRGVLPRGRPPGQRAARARLPACPPLTRSGCSATWRCAGRSAPTPLTALRTAAVAALVADTDRSVAGAGAASASGPCTWTARPASTWLTARARSATRRRRPAAVAHRAGGDHRRAGGQRSGLPVDPDQAGRPRGGREPVKPGLTPAAVRTLHAAHRNLVSRVLGVPLRPGAIRAQGPGRLQAPAAQAGEAASAAGAAGR